MSEVKFCSNCGAKLIDNALFCTNCGAKKSNETNQNYENRTINVFADNSNNGTENNENASRIYTEQATNDPTKQQFVSNQGGSQKNNKNNTALIIGIVAAVLFTLAIIGMIVEKTAQNLPTNQNVAEVSTDNNSYNNHAEEENKAYEKGILTESTYESEFIGVRYRKHEGWTLKSEDELNATLGHDANTVWEMQAIAYDGSNVIIGIEKLPTRNISMDDYIFALEKNTNNNSQVQVSDFKKEGTHIIAGEEYQALSFKTAVNGATIDQWFYCRKIDSHMIVFTVTPFGMSNVDILNEFYSY